MSRGSFPPIDVAGGRPERWSYSKEKRQYERRFHDPFTDEALYDEAYGAQDVLGDKSYVPQTLPIAPNPIPILGAILGFLVVIAGVQIWGSTIQTLSHSALYTVAPTGAPSLMPTFAPTLTPTFAPTKTPTKSPTLSPTKAPTAFPTKSPTKSPTNAPTNAPTAAPPPTAPTPATNAPTNAPTKSPTNSPTKAPTPPTNAPTKSPTVPATNSPTLSPVGAQAVAVISDTSTLFDLAHDKISNPINYQIHVAPRGELVATHTETFSDTGGRASVDNNEDIFLVSCGTSLGGYGVVRTAEYILNEVGQTTIARLTVAFDTDHLIANSLQGAGYILAGENYQVGYDGSKFGVTFQHHGQLEIRRFYITTKATSGTTVSITANSYTVSGISVTVAASAAHNAKEITNALKADSTWNNAWTTSQEGAYIVIQAKAPESRAGTYSFAPGTSGIVGSWTQRLRGRATTKEWAYRDSAPFFNGGSDLSWLQPGYFNSYQILYSREAGALDFYVQNEDNGIMQHMHGFRWNNQYKRMNSNNANFKIGYVATSLGSVGANITVRGGDMMLGSTGIQPEAFDSTYAHSKTTTGVTTTDTYLFAIKASPVFARMPMNSKIVFTTISASSDTSKTAILTFRLGCTTITGSVWQYVSQGASYALYDDSGTGCTSTTISGGINVKSVAETLSIRDTYALQAEQILAVYARVSSGAASEVDVTINWQEHSS